ncbi:MAG: hypothetical protein FWG74_04440, partial [Planctomycetes bacterium]|nr:hypothetical protein [Planctomycetota bacterium]
ALRLQGIEALSLDHDWANDRWRRFAMAMNRHNRAGLIRRLDLLNWFASGEPDRILAGQILEIPKAKPIPDSEPKTRRQADTDPGLAFWGEFAGNQANSQGGGECPTMNMRCPMAGIMGMAEKGWESFWKTGESFLKTLHDKI